MKLMDIAKVIRSKNAGPRCTTLDIMFASIEDFDRVCASKNLNKKTIAHLYDVPEHEVKEIQYPISMAIKFSIPRKVTAGDPGDKDVYGAQQHARLFNIDIE
jgi:hypothetical protein